VILSGAPKDDTFANIRLVRKRARGNHGSLFLSNVIDKEKLFIMSTHQPSFSTSLFEKEKFGQKSDRPKDGQKYFEKYRFPDFRFFVELHRQVEELFRIVRTFRKVRRSSARPGANSRKLFINCTPGSLTERKAGYA
jgi:hypothetical protein